MDALQFYSPSGDESGPSRRPSLSTSDTLERLTNKVKFELELEVSAGTKRSFCLFVQR